MPVTVRVASHEAQAQAQERRPHISSVEALLEHSCKNEFRECKEILQSSFTGEDAEINASNNGFIHTTILAYNKHHHLILRPEDIWLAILTQFSFYFNHHAENFRDTIVCHAGTEEVEAIQLGDRYTADMSTFTLGTAGLIHKRIRYPDLVDWMLPSFSTTVENDRIVAAIVMMGTLRKYFTYKFSTRCGIPSVTLLGEKDDWHQLLEKINRLEMFGSECRQWVRYLRPILTRFEQTFDTPDLPEVEDFWNRIVHHDSGSGVDHITGWLTVFCFWSVKGKRLFAAGDKSLQSLHPDRIPNFIPNFRVETADLPPGYARVPITFDDNGYVFDAVLIAGSVATAWRQTGESARGSNRFRSQLNTVQPLSGWWMYAKRSEEKKKEVHVEVEAPEAHSIGKGGR